MNPLTNIRNIAKLNEQELKLGVFDEKLSWHAEYKDSAYIFIGGLPYDLSEGDLICVFSQYGEIVNINLVRDKQTGKTKGYGFLAYEDQRSTILAVDNLNSAKLGGRTLRVDHVSEYRRPKGDEKDESGKFKEIIEEGCAPKTPPTSESEEEEKIVKKEKKKKHKKEKKKKKDIKKEMVDKDKYRKSDNYLTENKEDRSTSRTNSRHDSRDRSKSPEYRTSYRKTESKSKRDDNEHKSTHSYRDSYTKDTRERVKRDRSYSPDHSSRKHSRKSNSPHRRDRSRDHSNRRY